MIKLGFIEDNATLLDNYKDFFSNESWFEIAFAIHDIKKLGAIGSSCVPDMILLDLMLPSGNSLDFLHIIKQKFPQCIIIILSGVSDQAMTKAALQRGANGFLLKTSSMQFIKDALIKTAEGGTPLSPSIVNHLIQFENRQTLTEAYPDLTKREAELIDLLRTGMSSKMAASSLCITFFTINQHLKSIYKKLHIHSKTELMVITNAY